MCDLKHFSVKNTSERVDWCEKRCSRFALLREGKIVGSYFLTVMARSGWHHVPSFIMKDALLEKRVVNEISTKN